MKLPFTFGNRLVFRLVLPGLMLALVTIPGFHAALAAMTGEQISPTAYLPLLTVFLGWLMTLADMPVYMLFEGRRFWPEPIFSWALNRERRRLHRLLEESKSASESGNERASLEKQVDASRFPLDASGERFAAMPTRLGNLVYEYEYYPKNKYGLDSVFFYYRLWVTIDDELRNEIDSQQAAVDGAVYGSFILAIACPVMLLYALFQFLIPGSITWLEPWWLAMLGAVACGLGSRAVYLLSLAAQAQYGELYKSIFDQHRSKLNLQDVAQFLEEVTGERIVDDADFRRLNMAVWRYLRWHRVRLSASSKNENFEDVVKRRATACAAVVAQQETGRRSEEAEKLQLQARQHESRPA